MSSSLMPAKSVEFSEGPKPQPVTTAPEPNTPYVRIVKKSKVVEHKHELVVLNHLAKRRLRKLIRQLRNRKFYLHLKRQYKRSARDRKLLRRSENARKKAITEKTALKAPKNGTNQDPDQSKNLLEKPKGHDGLLKSTTSRFKEPRRHQKWRENRYRKWKKLGLRARFTKQETADREFDYLHPMTRPFAAKNFGLSKSEDLVRRLHKSRLSARWTETLYPGRDQFSLKPVPKVNPKMISSVKPDPEKTTLLLKKMLSDDWKLSNHDRLRRDDTVKAMARLVIQAKERYDLEYKRSQTSVNLGRPDSQVEIDNKINQQLCTKLKKLLIQRPSERLRTLERKLLPQILRDTLARRNTFINRPKTNYDSYIRGKLNNQVLQKYLQNRHLLALGKTSKNAEEDYPRMPLPYRRFIVGHLRPPKLYLAGARLRSAKSRMGLQPAQPLLSILPQDYKRERIKKPSEKRPKYPKHRDPHNPDKATSTRQPKQKKEPGKDKEAVEKTKGKSASKAGGKKGKTPVQRGPPPKGTRAYKRWHRKQKGQRRKRKLRNWIIMAEKRRRIKITQEILQEEHFKGKRDLPAMRKKVRELEQQSTKAKELVTYMSRRNEYLKEQFKDKYTRKHSEYYSGYLEWREESDTWFKLRDEIDTTNDEIKLQAAGFLQKCQEIIEDTAELEAILEKEQANLQTNYQTIVQFIKHEPIWQEEIDDLLCKTRYYDFLYTFVEAREEGNLNLVSDLLQRKMHKDFMNMAYQERRKMRRQLPSACKNMLDERGLLTQELNKISMWCNRLYRKKEKTILPEIKKLQKDQSDLRGKIHDQVVRRQPVLIQSFRIKRHLRGRNLQWPRKKTSLLKANIGLNRTRRKLEKTEYHVEEEMQTNGLKRAAVEAMKGHIASLQGMVTRDYHQRQVNCQVMDKVATLLKRAFGVPDDFNSVHWPASGATQGGLASDPNGMVARLKDVLEIARVSSSKAVIDPVKQNISLVRDNLFHNVPVSLQKFSS